MEDKKIDLVHLLRIMKEYKKKDCCFGEFVAGCWRAIAPSWKDILKEACLCGYSVNTKETPEKKKTAFEVALLSPFYSWQEDDRKLETLKDIWNSLPSYKEKEPDMPWFFKL